VRKSELGKPTSLIMKGSHLSVLGCKSVGYDAGSTTTASIPSASWYFHLGNVSPAAYTSVAFQAQITIEYQIEFFNKTLMEVSLLEDRLSSAYDAIAMQAYLHAQATGHESKLRESKNASTLQNRSGVLLGAVDVLPISEVARPLVHESKTASEARQVRTNGTPAPSPTLAQRSPSGSENGDGWTNVPQTVVPAANSLLRTRALPQARSLSLAPTLSNGAPPNQRITVDRLMGLLRPPRRVQWNAPLALDELLLAVEDAKQAATLEGAETLPVEADEQIVGTSDGKEV
jgi:hypothetical protein